TLEGAVALGALRVRRARRAERARGHAVPGRFVAELAAAAPDLPAIAAGHARGRIARGVAAAPGRALVAEQRAIGRVHAGAVDALLARRTDRGTVRLVDHSVAVVVDAVADLRTRCDAAVRIAGVRARVAVVAVGERHHAIAAP